jgi:hypothetical protein
MARTFVAGILVVALHPIHQVAIGTGLVAALRRHVEQHIARIDEFIATAIGRIGMENVAFVAVRVFVKDAEAGQFIGLEIAKFVIVVDGPQGLKTQCLHRLWSKLNWLHGAAHLMDA